MFLLHSARVSKFNLPSILLIVLILSKIPLSYFAGNASESRIGLV
jgi:hypothetical protein